VVANNLGRRYATIDFLTGAQAAREQLRETLVRRGGSAAGTRLLAISVEGRLLAFAPRVEPAPATLEALPGTAVPEPAPPQAAASPPTGNRERR
jgi:hypothetical protein